MYCPRPKPRRSWQRTKIARLIQAEAAYSRSMADTSPGSSCPREHGVLGQRAVQSATSGHGAGEAVQGPGVHQSPGDGPRVRPERRAMIAACGRVPGSLRVAVLSTVNPAAAARAESSSTGQR